MAYPLETAVETALQDIETTLAEDKTVPGSREAIDKWRQVLAFIESLPGTGYTIPLGNKRTWANDDLYNGPND